MKVAARSLSNPVDEWIIVKCDNLYNIKKSYIWDSFNMLSKSTAVRPEKDQTGFVNISACSSAAVHHVHYSLGFYLKMRREEMRWEEMRR